MNAQYLLSLVSPQRLLNTSGGFKVLFIYNKTKHFFWKERDYSKICYMYKYFYGIGTNSWKPQILIRFWDVNIFLCHQWISSYNTQTVHIQGIIDQSFGNMLEGKDQQTHVRQLERWTNKNTGKSSVQQVQLCRYISNQLCDVFVNMAVSELDLANTRADKSLKRSFLLGPETWK